MVQSRVQRLHDMYEDLVMASLVLGVVGAMEFLTEPMLFQSWMSQLKPLPENIPPHMGAVTAVGLVLMSFFGVKLERETIETVHAIVSMLSLFLIMALVFHRSLKEFKKKRPSLR